MSWIQEKIRRWKREPSDNINSLAATVGSILLLFASVIADSDPENSLFVYSILPAYVSLSMIFLFAMWFLTNDYIVLEAARDVSFVLMFQTLVITLFSGIVNYDTAVFWLFSFLSLILIAIIVGLLFFGNFTKPVNLPNLTFKEQRRWFILGLPSGLVFTLWIACKLLGLLNNLLELLNRRPEWLGLWSSLIIVSIAIFFFGLLLLWKFWKFTKAVKLTALLWGISTGTLLVYWFLAVFGVQDMSPCKNELIYGIIQTMLHTPKTLHIVLIISLFGAIYLTLFRHYLYIKAQKYREQSRTLYGH